MSSNPCSEISLSDLIVQGPWLSAANGHLVLLRRANRLLALALGLRDLKLEVEEGLGGFAGRRVPPPVLELLAAHRANHLAGTGMQGLVQAGAAEHVT